MTEADVGGLPFVRQFLDGSADATREAYEATCMSDAQAQLDHAAYIALDHQPTGSWTIVINEPHLVQTMCDCTCGEAKCQFVAVSYRSEMFHDLF